MKIGKHIGVPHVKGSVNTIPGIIACVLYEMCAICFIHPFHSYNSNLSWQIHHIANVKFKKRIPYFVSFMALENLMHWHASCLVTDFPFYFSLASAAPTVFIIAYDICNLGLHSEPFTAPSDSAERI